jgi:TRAP-type C4-dicarboxylate transport system permease small subunit
VWTVLAVACVAFSLATTYCAFRLIRLHHHDESPNWAVPLMGLIFISTLVSAWLLGQYLLQAPIHPGVSPFSRWPRIPT